MSQIVHKMKKVLSGCMNNKTNYKYNESDMMCDPILSSEELQNESPKPVIFKNKAEIPIYNDYDIPNTNNYDNLNHKSFIKNNVLQDMTNKKSSKKLRKGLGKKPEEKNSRNNENFNYSELYDRKIIEDKRKSKLSESPYCEITSAEFEFMMDFESGSDLLKEPMMTSTVNEKTHLLQNDTETIDNTQIKEKKSLTDLRSIESFASEEEGFQWYLSLLNETIVNCIQSDKTLNEAQKTKRLGIAKAHLFYARNFYKMRISASTNLKAKFENTHPCLIVLACLLDSEVVRVEESHACVCDTYIYLFSTRLKYCAWKSKLFVLLKKPKHSSLDRLNLIEDLTNCHKLIQEKKL